jgi:hypothetical protein
MTKSNTLALIVLVLGFGVQGMQAIAGDNPKDDGKTTIPSQPLSWEDFKKACADPGQFGKQQPPSDIRIICKDTTTSWVGVESGQMDLDSNRKITAEVKSDKFHVVPQTNDAAVSDRTGSCTRYKEVEQVYMAPEVVVTCADILNHKGTLQEFCATKVDESKGKNPKLTTTTDTNRAPIDTCLAPGVVIKHKDDKGDGV